MGLDSFWMKKTDNGDFDVLEMSFEPELKVCGGLFSANGNGSFRGKAYADLIETVTGVSLYQDEISNETVREMSARMQEAEIPGDELLHEWNTMPEEWEDIKRMFKAYSEAGAILHGWW